MKLGHRKFSFIVNATSGKRLRRKKQSPHHGFTAGEATLCYTAGQNSFEKREIQLRLTSGIKIRRSRNSLHKRRCRQKHKESHCRLNTLPSVCRRDSRHLAGAERPIGISPSDVWTSYAVRSAKAYSAKQSIPHQQSAGTAGRVISKPYPRCPRAAP